MKGRKPIPTHLKLLRGNPGKRALPANEPEVEPGADMPDYLSPDAQVEWEKISQKLTDAGVLTEIDATALALYCESFATWKDASAKVRTIGAVVKAPSGFPVQSPYLAIANKAFEQMMKCLVEFGMTPSSRTRVTSNQKKQRVNPFSEFKR